MVTATSPLAPVSFGNFISQMPSPGAPFALKAPPLVQVSWREQASDRIVTIVIKPNRRNSLSCAVTVPCQFVSTSDIQKKITAETREIDRLEEKLYADSKGAQVAEMTRNFGELLVQGLYGEVGAVLSTQSTLLFLNMLDVGNGTKSLCAAAVDHLGSSLGCYLAYFSMYRQLYARGAVDIVGSRKLPRDVLARMNAVLRKLEQDQLTDAQALSRLREILSRLKLPRSPRYVRGDGSFDEQSYARDADRLRRLYTSRVERAFDTNLYDNAFSHVGALNVRRALKDVGFFQAGSILPSLAAYAVMTPIVYGLLQGGVGTVVAGLVGTVSSFLVFNAVYYPFYEAVRRGSVPTVMGRLLQGASHLLSARSVLPKSANVARHPRLPR